MDEEKKLSSEEQREKMKQEYLEELKLRKQILDKMKEANKINKINENLEQVMKLAQISDEMDEFINKLNAHSEIAESKLDISLQESHQENNDSKVSSHEDLLNQIKQEMGLLENKLQEEFPELRLNETTKTLLEEEKSSFYPSAEKKFTTKTLGEEEH
jgi:thiamine biosynthesis lipoprotein ApbE